MATRPGPVRNFSGVSNSPETIDLSWDAPSTGDEVSDYQLQWKEDDQFGNLVGSRNLLAPASSFQITGLRGGNTYFIEIIPFSDSLTGPLSSITVTTSSSTVTTPKPDAPSAPSLSATHNQITATWSSVSVLTGMI